MISLSLLSPTYTPENLIRGPDQLAIEPSPLIVPAKDEVLFLSRRPAILTYTSPLVAYSERLASLPLYVLGIRKEAETLVVPMAESVSFQKGWKNVPKYAFIEVQAAHEVQVYSAAVHFTARLAGLRWFMYYQRVLTFFVGTTVFWIAEMVFTLVGWVLLRSIGEGAEEKYKKKAIKHEDETDERQKVKEEEEDLETDEPDISDTPRTFPTYGRSAPLRYIPHVKDEEDSEEYNLEDIPPVEGEADDEGDGEEVNGTDVGSARVGGR